MLHVDVRIIYFQKTIKLKNLPLIESLSALSLLGICVLVHGLATQVCADPETAVADIVYPALQLLQSTVSVSHNVPADPAAIVGVPFGQVHILATHV